MGDTKAHFAHGQPMAQVEGGPVNIWYWKNKDGKGSDLGAKGSARLPHSHQDVKAKGVYQGGVEGRFRGPLSTEHVAEDTQFKPGEFGSIASLFGTAKWRAASRKKRVLKKRFHPGGIFRADAPPDYSRTCTHYSRWARAGFEMAS